MRALGDKCIPLRMNQPPHPSRRTFLKMVGGAVLGMPAIIPSRVLGQAAPSKQISLGFIGLGAQGMNYNLKLFLNEPDARVVAVCDAYRSRAEKAARLVDERQGTRGCKVYGDFRRLLEDPSIDAVVISTPDHWHVPMCLMALEAGKDVFCEKPTLCIDEGRDLVAAVAKHNAVFQAGIEDRSLVHFHKMVEWVKNGAVGTLRRVEVTLPQGHAHPKEAPCAPPEDLDWNLWLGPAAYHEYTPRRTHMWHWRYISDYSKGALLDIGTHLADTAQLGVNAPGVCPVAVEGTGHIPVDCESDVPSTFDLTYRYANDVEMTVKSAGRPGWDPKCCSLRFEGDAGWIQRMSFDGGIEASDPQILRQRYTPETSKHWPLPPSEHRNFLDCVTSRKKTTYPAIDLHHMSTMLHMGIIAINVGRKLRWDLETERFDDASANAMLGRPAPRDWSAQT